MRNLVIDEILEWDAFYTIPELQKMSNRELIDLLIRLVQECSDD